MLLLALFALLDLGTGLKAKRTVSECLLCARHRACHSSATPGLTCSLQSRVEAGVVGSVCPGKEKRILESNWGQVYLGGVGSHKVQAGRPYKSLLSLPTLASGRNLSVTLTLWLKSHRAPRIL